MVRIRVLDVQTREIRDREAERFGQCVDVGITGIELNKGHNIRPATEYSAGDLLVFGGGGSYGWWWYVGLCGPS